MYDEFFNRAHALLSEGLPFATAVVVRAEKPTSARPGDKAIVTAEGVMHGWIGGSCAQPTVIEEAIKALADGSPRLIRLSTDPESHAPREGLVDLPMTCFSGGTLEIYIEPQLPAPRLMVVGNLPVAQALARLGKVMNYQVIAVDPDTRGAGMPDADEVVTDLERMAGKITPLTYVVVASHGRYDEVALEQALRSRAAYVALVASRARSSAVLEYLAAQGLGEEELARLKYPAGLDIQAMRGDEIALSIMAEIVQRRRSGEEVDVPSLLAGQAPAAAAIDPVCGMAVPIAGAEHVYEYDGQTFYFCCAGCRASFAGEPEKYLAQPAPAGEAIDPVCGMTVDIASARYMSEYEGQLFYFCAAGCKLAFDKAPGSYVEGAHHS
jgi:xanthine dehydrogenase accessory factor